MTQSIRKNRTFYQKKKRPSSHQVGKRLEFSRVNKRLIDNFGLKQILLKTNKEYRKFENQLFLGAFLILGPSIYFLVGIIYIFIVKVVYEKFLMSLLERLLSTVTLGGKPLIHTVSYSSSSIWELLKTYSMGNIIFMIVVIFLFILGIVIFARALKNQKLIEENVDLEDLKKVHSKLI
ncbi:hypothetical protein [Streptococcus sanguinis]|uniref:Uncharacterized protein n=1 Tax=Streptococcus sanguinis TaxID=1305 RepID=A0A7H8V4I3_STRSA|nr:hypothetical protein [Streptococcus sanguinis]QLB51108.1 hypothetical protein FDP16_11990 [Streptococcus sanguinis]